MAAKRFSMIMALIALILAGTHGTARAALSSTGIEDQKGVSITVYNSNLALVKDIRHVSLRQGAFGLRFMDVASMIIPPSVSIKSLVDPASLFVLEQNYEYDLLNPKKLMDKYVGKKVKLITKNPYTEREEMVEAVLLSNNGMPIYRIGDEITFGHPGRVVFPRLPEDLISKPTLVWLLENDLKAPQRLEATYLTRGINWRSDYVLTLNENDRLASLTGWVTIDNKSGAAYRDANIKLVAGDINRSGGDLGRFRYDRIMLKAAEAESRNEQFKENSFFEYHIYTLKRTSTIKNNQSKQISLLEADNVPVRKEFTYYGAAYYYRSRHGTKISNQKIGVYVQLENKKKNNLGMPLPKGTVRVYKKDPDGGLQFIGEDTIDHTPKDEKIRIKVGDAFDIVGERTQTDWRKVASDTYEAAFEISLRNHKDQDITVNVIEPIPGDWRMLVSSHDHEKTEAHTALFKVRVPKNKERKLTYRVRMRF